MSSCLSHHVSLITSLITSFSSCLSSRPSHHVSHQVSSFVSLIVQCPSGPFSCKCRRALCAFHKTSQLQNCYVFALPIGRCIKSHSLPVSPLLNSQHRMKVLPLHDALTFAHSLGWCTNSHSLPVSLVWPPSVASKYSRYMIDFEAHLPLLRALRTQVSFCLLEVVSCQ